MSFGLSYNMLLCVFVCVSICLSVCMKLFDIQSVIMPGRKRKKPSSYVPEAWVSEDEDGEVMEHLRHVPPVPFHYQRLGVGRSAPPPVFQKSSDLARFSPPPSTPRPVPQVCEPVSSPLSSPQAVEAHQLPHPQQAVQLPLAITEPPLPVLPTDDVALEVESQHGAPEQSRTVIEHEHEMEVDEEDDEHEVVEVEEDKEDEQDEQDEQDEDDEDDEDDEQEVDVNPIQFQSFDTIFQKLIEDWLLAEVDHKVSKTATNLFWKIANTYFPSLYAAKEREGRRKRVPQFKQARKKLHQKNVPKVSMKMAFKHNKTGEISVVKGESTPTSKYPPNVYTKLYEVASVEVNM